MSRSTCTTAAALTIVIASTFAIGRGASAAADDQARADDAVASFTASATEAGLVSTGPGMEGDVLGLLPSDEADSPSAAASNACLEPIAGVVAEDGSFTGEMARATSDAFSSASEEPMSTDMMAFAETNEISAVVAFVDDAGVEGIDRVIDGFESGEFLDCVAAAITSVPPSSDVPVPDFEFSSEALDLGDNSVQVDVSIVFAIGEDDYTSASTLAIARVGRAIAIVTYTSDGEQLADWTTSDALETLVDSLG